MNRIPPPKYSRRAVLSGLPSLAVAISLVPIAEATPVTMADAIKAAVGEGAIQTGRVTLEVPSLVENGNSVPLLVRVDSPMSVGDHVAMVYIFSEKNPSPNVVRFTLWTTRGRGGAHAHPTSLERSGSTAIARMADGSLWTGTADAIVTEAACIDGT